jgi:hypothetical protein
MAPEVLGGSPATQRSDLYGLGVLLFRLLTRRLPVVADSLEGLRLAHATGVRHSVSGLRSDLPPVVAAQIDQVCHPDPEKRSSSASEVATALVTALGEMLSSQPPARTTAERWWVRLKRPALVAMLALGSILTLAGAAWDQTPGRALRRVFGLSAPPRSPLYIALNGGLAIVRGRRLELHAQNAGLAGTIAVSRDLGVRITGGMPPWIPGGAFALDGTPLSAAIGAPRGICCFADGTTDGVFNYAALTDSTLLDPIGSRVLASPGVYRFGRDWSNAERLFPLPADGVYEGIGYAGASRTFFLTRRFPDRTAIEQWSAGGQLLATPIVLRNAYLRGLAIDPLDGTLWLYRVDNPAPVLRLENFEPTGPHVASLEIVHDIPNFGPTGAEFAWLKQ